MEFVIHRINTLEALKEIPSKYGCEIDIRANNSQLYLHHDPFKKGELLDNYLDAYTHGLLVLNIKEAGIEKYVIEAVEKRGITNYFLLDVEFPYLYKAAKEGIRKIAVRYSEDEPIELLKKYHQKIDWVWIDTNTKLPINKSKIDWLKKVKSCLVCPERWGRPQDIQKYKTQMKKLNFEPTAIMTSINNIKNWEEQL